VVDLSTPADVNVALLYIASILACFWTRSRPLVWGAACASLCLSVVAVVVGRPAHPGALQGVIWANRSITALAELALAGVVSVWMRTSVAAAEDHLVVGQLAQTFDLAQAFIRRKNGEIVYWSRGAQDLYGWSAEEAVGRVSHELLRTTFPEELARIESDMSKVSRWSGELRHLCKNGEPIWVASNWTLGNAIAGFGEVVVEVNNDITGLKQTERALNESEQRFRRLSEANVVGIVIADFDRVLEANDQFLGMLGYRREETGLLTWEQLTPRDEAEQRETIFRQLVETGRSATVEIELNGSKGRRVPVLAGGVVIDDHFLAFVIDQTERVRLQKQLAQAQRLESIGQLAGGVAHDFNNLLTIMIGQVEIVLHALGEGDPARRRLESVAHAADRAATLTRQLLTFSRHQPTEPEELDLNEVVRSAEPILRRLIREDIESVLELRAASGTIRATSAELDQVLFNLVVNARDAMPDGGKLLIETTDIFIDGEYAEGHLGVKAGRYALLTVSDTGMGMEEAVKERIFEPFFTTKEQGKGTGLGLATVYGVVKKFGGAISVYSEVGQGTVFKLLFPEVPGRVSGLVVRPAETALPAAGGTILVAEDEPDLRFYIQELLERGGYRVLTAGNGREALQMAEEHRGEVDLLLTDVVMPQMGGDELSARFRERWPGIPVLRMSGYAERLRNDPAPESHYIQKPFAPGALLEVVRRLRLGEPAGGAAEWIGRRSEI
jgi:two-component system cell cycle sensor histidine kinase/response regulator CckA